ncbi:MAG TPA: hypothetical protein VLV31_09365 [Candidatus Acidoferrales bacterium]|nr:hypothetical protein [Candidatus Acidoferrales bacterium]
MSSLQEEFDVWVNSVYSNPFWVRRHRFEKSVTGEIRVDNGVFNREEATILFRMLNSRDPFSRLNANFVIWERNRSLIILLVIVTAILLALMITRIER